MFLNPLYEQPRIGVSGQILCINAHYLYVNLNDPLRGSGSKRPELRVLNWRIMHASSSLSTTTPSPTIITITQMTTDKASAPKLDVDEYLTSAISVTPADLHRFFTAFLELYNRKYVTRHLRPGG